MKTLKTLLTPFRLAFYALALVAIVALELVLFGELSETCDSSRNYDFED